MKKPPSRDLLDRIADRLKALADPVRLELLHALQNGERSVGDLVRIIGGSQGNVSKHLARMRQAGIVAPRREGTTSYYRVIDPAAFAICRTCCDALEEQVESDRSIIRSGRARIGTGRISSPAITNQTDRS